jgi:biopolymer transport protein ExbD
MKLFRKNLSKSGNDIPTSALPDIIFMLLFFFMVTTVLREDDLLVKNEVPLARQLNKIERKSLVSHIYIGSPEDVKLYGDQPRIQVNDVLIQPEGLINFATAEIGKVPVAEQGKFIMSLNVDKEAAMGIVIDVQQSLRKADARRVLYASHPEGGEGN